VSDYRVRQAEDGLERALNEVTQGASNNAVVYWVKELFEAMTEYAEIKKDTPNETK